MSVYLVQSMSGLASTCGPRDLVARPSMRSAAGSLGDVHIWRGFRASSRRGLGSPAPPQ
jgi:hypothetical protein